MSHELIAVGTSWGGLHALSTFLESLPREVTAAIAVAQHRQTEPLPGALESILQTHTTRQVSEASDKQPIETSRVYLAPPDYHLLVERGTFALSVDERVRFSRPSIDVLFESAADAYGERLVGIVLTGSNEDGAVGLARIEQLGGVAIVQDPATAERREMPEAAIASTRSAEVMRLEQIGFFLARLSGRAAERSPA